MSENIYPQLCREVGLNCTECAETVAEQTARVCTGLRGKAVGQLFVQLFPNSACAPMHGRFEAAYLQSQRKGPGRAELRVASAMA